MKKASNKKDIDIKEDSFLYKYKNDKQYNAKVQLTFYGVFILIVILGVNIFSGFSNKREVYSNSEGNKNAYEESTNMLESNVNNYQYDVVMDVKYINVNDEEVAGNIRYSGKKYDKVMEINKLLDNSDYLYYKLNDKYYSKNNDMVEYVKDDIIYDIVDSDYIEIDSVLKLINKASLDRVTDYSSGKKEYVYNIKVKDIVASYQMEDVIEFSAYIEDDILYISVDYSNLIKVIDKNITYCNIKYTISRVNDIKEDEIVFNIDNSIDIDKDNGGEN